jgi:hypothetical protein
MVSIRDVTMGEKECRHEWEVSPMVLDFNPPIYHRTCARCGAVQERALI